MLVRFGRARFTLPEFAYATRLSQLLIRRTICDMHHLFRLVLSKHLDRVMDEVARVPRGTPNLMAARRAAYFSATRGACNVPLPMHFLLTSDRFSLPEDELETIEQQRALIGQLVGGQNAGAILNLLDSPLLDLEKIEAAIAGIERIDSDRLANPPAPDPLPYATPQIEPEPPPPPPPKYRPFPISRLSPELAQVRDADLLMFPAKQNQEESLGGMKPFPPNPPASFKAQICYGAANPANALATASYVGRLNVTQTSGTSASLAQRHSTNSGCECASKRISPSRPLNRNANQRCRWPRNRPPNNDPTNSAGKS
jgi:hypothetical protein